MKTICTHLLASLLLLIALPSLAGWKVDSLAGNRYNMLSLQLGSKAIFGSTATWDLYDFNNGQWMTGNFSQGRVEMQAAATATKAYFAGGFIGPFTDRVAVNTVDIYNAPANSWSLAHLSQARGIGAAAAAGSSVIFAGGRQVLSYSARVDLFDVNTNIRTIATLSQARTAISVAVVGNKAIFAGGQSGSIINGTIFSSNKVDIYDATNATWSTSVLSARRQGMAVAVVGTKAIFAGGINMANGAISKVVDIYDAATNTWSTAQLSQTKYALSAAVANGKVYFAGGVINGSGVLSNRVEIFDANNNSWSFVILSSPRMGMVSGSTPSRLMFAGGTTVWGNTGSDRVEVLNLSNNTWSVEYLVQPRLGMASASYGTRVLFAGGNQVTSSYSLYTIPSNKVDIWDDTFPLTNNTSVRMSENSLPDISMSLYPNPTASELYIRSVGFGGTRLFMEVYTITGLQVKNQEMQMQSDLKIDVEGLVSGVYLLKLSDDLGHSITRRFEVSH